MCPPILRSKMGGGIRKANDGGEIKKSQIFLWWFEKSSLIDLFWECQIEKSMIFLIICKQILIYPPVSWLNTIGLSYLYPCLKPRTTVGAGFNGSSQKSLMLKIFAVGHRKIVNFPALAKNDKQLSFLQKSDAFLPQFNLYQKGRCGALHHFG